MRMPEMASDSVNQWMQIDRDQDTRNQLQNLIEQGENVEERLNPLNRLQFGTAGLRGVLGPGYMNMNSVVVAETAQGIVSYCLRRFPDLTAAHGVCVAHDMRHCSEKFAAITAGVFVAAGIRVHLFDFDAPTPYCAFTTGYLGCVMGVMVTASHNPSEYNGYKVYGMGCGAQIIEPIDSEIEAEIMNCLEISEQTWAYESFLTKEYEESGLLIRVTRDSPIVSEYHESIRSLARPAEPPAKGNLKVYYSAMWGVGCIPFRRAVTDFGLTAEISCSDLSCTPDPDFGGTARPNPEEAENMLSVADRAGESSLIVANDPDADRLAIAELCQDGTWKVFHGNEIGLILAWYMLQITSGVSNRCIACSTVSTRLLQKVALLNNCEFEETLTGFKWIGRAGIRWAAELKNMVFGFEEAIGYTCGGESGLLVNDKDGISAACVLIQLAESLHTEGGTLDSYLQHIYSETGHACWQNGGFSVQSLDEVRDVIGRFFAENGDEAEFCSSHDRSYIEYIGKFKLNRVRDLHSPGYDSAAGDKKPVLPCSDAEMLTLYAKNVVCTIRPSGTEPKLKYYIEAVGDDYATAKRIAREFRAALLRVMGVSQ